MDEFKILLEELTEIENDIEEMLIEGFKCDGSLDKHQKNYYTNYLHQIKKAKIILSE